MRRISRCKNVFRKSTSVACGLSLSVMSCATLPQTGMPRTGEPLSVRERTEVYSYTEKQKVGEVEHRDAEGRSLGTSSAYANVTRHQAVQLWQTYQGESPVDEQDFFTIAEKLDTARRIQETRESALKINRIGWGAAAAGTAVAIVGGLVLSSTYSNMATPGQNPSPGWATPVGYGLTIGGALVGLGGYYAALLTGPQLSPEYHHSTQQEAMQAAAEYNGSLRPARPSVESPPAAPVAPPATKSRRSKK